MMTELEGPPQFLVDPLAKVVLTGYPGFGWNFDLFEAVERCLFLSNGTF